jgi:glycosyltransferase involved in cell wall biosynthesis
MTSNDQGVDYSIVVPVYYNEGALTKTMDALKTEVIERHPRANCEVIFIDDGSGDGSLEELLRLRQRDPEIIRVVKLTRNFGQVNALTAGLNMACGQCVVVMSADGQDPPDLINEMLESFWKGDAEIVICARQERDESRFRVVTSRVFYKLMRRLSFPGMPKGGFDFFLLGRRPLDAILENREAHPFLQGQVLWTGYQPKVIPYRRRRREIGKSKWSFGRKITYLLDGIMSYSFGPIRLMSVTGLLVAFSGFVYAMVILVDRLVWGNPIKGWAPIMIILLVVSGIQLLMLGVIGEYVWRTLAQVRHRQPYLIESVYEKE